MSGPNHYLYCDERSRKALGDDRPAVLLLGSYLGYANFGDILQLKGAISWHRKVTGLQPVLICDAASITGQQFAGQLLEWFDIAAVIFTSTTPLDLRPAGLEPIPSKTAIAYLHMYGGGFLNRYWGRGMIDLAESLHRRFRIKHYVLTGQQVDPALSEQLTEHFRQYPPLLAGGRDERSVEVLANCGADAAFSFDDATEPLQTMAGMFKSAPGPGAALDCMIHINLSAYTSQEGQALNLASCAKRINRLYEYLKARMANRRPRVALLQAYMDRRADVVADSLSVVQQLEDAFPFDACDLIHLARLAIGRPETASGILPPLLPDTIAITSSYHVSLLCAMLGIPCHLQASNAYYEQKRQGLGLPTESLEKFLRQPQPVSLSTQMAERSSWLDRLKDVYAEKIAAAEPEPCDIDLPADQRWQSKGGLLEVRARMQALETAHHQAGERIRELEQVKDNLWRETQELSAEAHRLAEGWETQKSHLAELEEVRDRLWNELQEAQSTLQESRNQIEILRRQRGYTVILAEKLRHILGGGDK